MVTENRVNIGSGNDLLPDDIKPLPEPMLTYHQLHPAKINSDNHQKITWSLISQISLKITYLTFL